MSENNDGAGHGDSVAPERKPLGGDLIIPVMAGGFTLYFLAETNHLAWEARANGVVIGGLLLLLIALQIGRTVLRRFIGHGNLGLGDLGTRDAVQVKRLAIIAVLILFVGTIGYLGTSLALFLTMGALMWILGVRKPTTLLMGSVGIAAVVYLGFILFLGTRLPRGPVENLLAALGGA